ncbi:hypothetical protein J6590_077372 [Homalodisca vitripennis]|nr:hypothetical protein J6590_077372 [Homalodisca vitripennis]
MEIKSFNSRATFVEVCYRDDPKVADCIKDRIHKLAPIFKSGSEDFDLVPLDPLVFPIHLFSYQSTLVGGKIGLPDGVILSGLTGIQVKSVKAKVNIPHKFVLDFDAHLPKINVKTLYNMTGNVIRIPVNMHGYVDFDAGDVDVSYHVAGNVKTIGDNEYLVLTNFDWKFLGEGIKSINVRNTDIVRGNPTLNRIVTAIVKSSWRQLKDAVIPAILPIANRSLKDIFAKFFQKYPYDIIFPKRTRSQYVSDIHYET